MRGTTRRRFLAAAAAPIALAIGGCVTYRPTLRTPTLSDSRIFERLSTTAPWSTQQIPVDITLTTAATTNFGVRELTVLQQDGTDFWTGPIQAGQTSASGFVPANETGTLTATDYDGRFVERLPITADGNVLL